MGSLTIDTPPMSLADALAYREQHRWRKIRPASLQAVDALADEVERLQGEFVCLAVTMFTNSQEIIKLCNELSAFRGAAQEPRDDYPGKDDAA